MPHVIKAATIWGIVACGMGVGTSLISFSQNPPLAQMTAEQAIFEESARLAEVVPQDGAFVFIGHDARLFFQAFQYLAGQDKLSAPEFALTGRIFWASDLEEARDLILPANRKAIHIYSSQIAETQSITQDCSSGRSDTQNWLLSYSNTDDDCVREHFLQSAERPWTEVQESELKAFAESKKHSMYYALKRRVWRHILTKLESGKVHEAVDAAMGLKDAPPSELENSKSVGALLKDLREIVVRYYRQHLPAFRQVFSGCDTTLATH